MVDVCEKCANSTILTLCVCLAFGVIIVTGHTINRDPKQLVLFPAFPTPFYYGAEQEFFRTAADSVIPATKTDVDSVPVIEEGSPVGRQYFGITNVFGKNDCPACPPTNSSCPVVNSTCPNPPSPCPPQLVQHVNFGGCPRTVEPYTSANAVISTSIKADAGVAYSCTFILAVPAPYTRIRLSCPVMIAVVRTTDGNGVTNIEMQPLTGSYKDGSTPAVIGYSRGSTITATYSSVTMTISSTSQAIDFIEFHCVWQGVYA